MANAITHGIGFILAIAVLTLLITFASLEGDAWRIVTLTIFGVTLAAMYLASTAYHLARTPRTKHWTRVIDHIAIYLLIAGTYTPFTLVMLRDGSGWILFAVVWGLALAGVIAKLCTQRKISLLSIGLYVAMGWLVLVAMTEVIRVMSGAGLAWLLAGGVFYTAGAGVYAWHRMRFNHAIWHVCVILGSGCHVIALWLDVLPVR